MDTLLFYVFAVVAVTSALGVILARRVFYAAVSLIVCLAALSGVYMVLESPFIAAVQKYYAEGKQPTGEAMPWPKDVYDRLQAIK